jgi:hypothetical protein
LKFFLQKRILKEKLEKVNEEQLSYKVDVQINTILQMKVKPVDDQLPTSKVVYLQQKDFKIEHQSLGPKS